MKSKGYTIEEVVKAFIVLMVAEMIQRELEKTPEYKKLLKMLVKLRRKLNEGGEPKKGR